MEEIIHGEKLGPRVVKVEPEEQYFLLITFNNGEVRRFDAKPLLKMKVFSKLNDQSFFRNVFVAYGSIAWVGGIDYCPDCLYLESVPVEC